MASRRQYLTQDELAEYADINITDGNEADDQISQAEEMIDDYVGYQEKFLCKNILGNMSAVAGDGLSFTLQADKISGWANSIDFFKGLHVEIIGGAGIGQMRKITGSTVLGVLTVETAFSPIPDTTSIYKIYQLGKFPRMRDIYFDSRVTPGTYYKSIPEDVKRAVAAQLQYVIEMGAAFFASDGEEVSESIGDYSVTRKTGGGVKSLIAPKARHLLRGIFNRTAEIVV
jgi:hypothetical protein